TDRAAEELHERLVPEAHTEYWDPAAQAIEDVHRRARVLGTAGPRGDDEVGGGECLRLVRRNLVVASDDNVGPELAEQVRQVVGERVVVVDQEDQRPTSAASIAASIAASLFRHSWCSSPGSDSATIPPPACMYARPFWKRTVRSAMHVSKPMPGR